MTTKEIRLSVMRVLELKSRKAAIKGVDITATKLDRETIFERLKVIKNIASGPAASLGDRASNNPRLVATPFPPFKRGGREIQ